MPGMESSPADRAVVTGVEVAEQLTARLRSARGDVSLMSGRMERESPLFHGTGENPLLF